MKKLVLFFILLSTLGCVSNKKHKSNAVENTSSDKITVTANASLSDSTIQFSIANNTNSSIFLFNPKQLHIEVNNSGTWEKIRTLSCPCGAPCARPAEFTEIAKGNKFSHSWNMEERWCGEQNEKGIPETIKSKVKPGLYRIMIIYSINHKEKIVYYKEFNV